MKIEYVSHKVIGYAPIDNNFFNTTLIVEYKLEGDTANLFGHKETVINVTQSNNMTGFEMDAQVLSEANLFITNFNNQI